jgi:ATP adenylyltransferase
MRYVGGGAKESGCVFCNRLAADDDVASLIVGRGETAFAIMNLFPYNTGHIMLAPNQHVASPETAEPAGLAEMAAMLPAVLRALRRALGCDGFNVGCNVGAIAGAGIASHLHQHVVPRWSGDANFMPIIASTMVLPELIPVTYAKVRAEVEREQADIQAVTVVVLDAAANRIAVDDQGSLPTARAETGRPLWRSARDIAGGEGATDLLGWAGPGRTGGAPGALAFRTSNTAPRGFVWRNLAADEAPTVAAAVRLADSQG